MIAPTRGMASCDHDMGAGDSGPPCRLAAGHDGPHVAASSSAPTLPTKAERQRARPWLEEQARHPLRVAPRTALRLLDFADACEVEDERQLAALHAPPGHPALTAELARLDDMPARRALRRLVDAVVEWRRVEFAYDSAQFRAGSTALSAAHRAAEAVLAGGQAAHRGPWALRHPVYEGIWCGKFEDADGGLGLFFLRAERHIFTKLGPANEPGTARWAQRMHGGVIVRVKGAAK